MKSEIVYEGIISVLARDIASKKIRTRQDVSRVFRVTGTNDFYSRILEDIFNVCGRGKSHEKEKQGEREKLHCAEDNGTSEPTLYI